MFAVAAGEQVFAAAQNRESQRLELSSGRVWQPTQFLHSRQMVRDINHRRLVHEKAHQVEGPHLPAICRQGAPGRPGRRVRFCLVSSRPGHLTKPVRYEPRHVPAVLGVAEARGKDKVPDAVFI